MLDFSIAMGDVVLFTLISYMAVKQQHKLRASKKLALRQFTIKNLASSEDDDSKVITIYDDARDNTAIDKYNDLIFNPVYSDSALNIFHHTDTIDSDTSADTTTHSLFDN
jgi:hypothetical protein